MENITSENVPWLFDTGNAQKRIASLEMVATVYLVKSVLWMLGSNPFTIPIQTDSKGNAFALLANRSKKWPVFGLLMELGMILHKHSSSIPPSLCKCKWNEWADQLTHLDSSGFSADKQATFPSSFEWLILHKLLELLLVISCPN